MKSHSNILFALYDYLILYLGLVWLGVLCIAWTIVAIILYPLLPKRHAQKLGRFVIMAGFRIYLASLTLSGRCSFDLTEIDNLRDEVPLIIAPNHPSLLDAVMIISRLPNVACVMKAGLMNNIFLGAGSRFARYICNEPIRKMVLLATRDLQSGNHLLLFPEGTRTTSFPVNTFKGSIALIAQHAGTAVQTVLIEADSNYLSKGWPLFRKPAMPINYRIRLGQRFDPPQDAHLFMTELATYFSQELAKH